MRTLTASHKAAMKDGRRRAEARRREAAARVVADYTAWLKLDAELMMDRVDAERHYGRDSAEFKAAYAAWKQALSRIPAIPRDTDYAMAA